MKEKKTFILAVPTLVIFILVVVGICIIFYNRNFKEMTKDDVKILAQKVATINNISCEVLTESSEADVTGTISDYKLCNGKLVSNVDNFKIYDDKNEKLLLQIDEKQKVVYQYKEYTSAIDEFETMICSVAKLLETDDYQYEFKDYETVNGIKCVSFSLSKVTATVQAGLGARFPTTVFASQHPNAVPKMYSVRFTCLTTTVLSAFPTEGSPWPRQNTIVPPASKRIKAVLKRIAVPNRFASFQRTTAKRLLPQRLVSIFPDVSRKPTAWKNRESSSCRATSSGFGRGQRFAINMSAFP